MTTLMSGPVSEKDQARFWVKVALPNEQGCMLWLAGQDRRGYGRFSLQGRTRAAHRISYELAYGRMPDAMVIDHVKDRGCANTSCVAPLHLEAVTQRENVRRGQAGAAEAARTHCPHGHPYDEENTYRDPRGRRRCRTCAAKWNRGVRPDANAIP